MYFTDYRRGVLTTDDRIHKCARNARAHCLSSITPWRDSSHTIISATAASYLNQFSLLHQAFEQAISLVTTQARQGLHFAALNLAMLLHMGQQSFLYSSWGEARDRWTYIGVAGLAQCRAEAIQASSAAGKAGDQSMVFQLTRQIARRLLVALDQMSNQEMVLGFPGVVPSRYIDLLRLARKSRCERDLCVAAICPRLLPRTGGRSRRAA